MFTPKRQWPGPSIAPKTEMRGTPDPTGKGKRVAINDFPPPPPPTRLLNENENVNGAENMDDWRRFREAGLLDETEFERRDREALLERVQKLEKELRDYQYNMGLLLIEKKESALKHEELQEALREVHEILKREKTAHLMEISQVEERETNLRKSCDAERQHVAKLMRELQMIQSEHARIKSTSEPKLADAANLVVGAENRSLELKQKYLTAEAKLTEASKKSLELERKLQEVETRESVLKRERMSFNSERSAHEVSFLKHKEDMLEWEKKLQEGEERLCQGRREIYEREEKVNEFNRVFKEKERELLEERKKIELSYSISKKKHDEVDKKLSDLKVKEEEVESLRRNLEMKEKQINALTEKLSTREKVEIQNLLDGHRSALDIKRQEFESELEKRKELFEEEMKAKHFELDQKKSNIDHMGEKLKIQEQALEKKSERNKEKEKDNELLLKGLKEKEKTLKFEEKNLNVLRKELASEKENLQTLKEEIENMKAEINQKELHIQIENEKLNVTAEDRKEHDRLKLDLEQEIERYRRQTSLLLKERDDLKKDRDKFEEEWETLDTKKAELAQDLQNLEQEKEKIEEAKCAKEKQLEDDRIETEQYVERELQALKLEKELFAATMKDERSALSEKSQNEHNQLVNEFEARSRKLEADMLHKHKELERTLQEKEKYLEEKIEREQCNVSHLKEVVKKEMEEVRLDRIRLEENRQDITLGKQQLEVQQQEMHKDINELGVLSQELKRRRKELVEERSRFVSFINTLKSCQICGSSVSDYLLSDLHIMELNDKDESPLQSLGDDILEKVASYKVSAMKSPGESHVKSSGSGGRISWLLQKCTPRIFNSKNVKDIPPKDLSDALVDAAVTIGEPSMPVGTAGKSDSPKDIPDESNQEAPEESNQEILKESNQEVPVESKNLELTGRQTRYSQKTGGIHRTRSVKAVVEDAEAFLRRSGDPKLDEEPDENVSVSARVESRGDSGLAGKATRSIPRKRTRSSKPAASEDAYDSDERSVSNTVGGRRKKRHNTGTPAVQNTGRTRYNLRRNKNTGKDVAAPTESAKRADTDVSDATMPQDNEITSTERVVRFQMPAADVDESGDAVKGAPEQTELSDVQEGGEDDDEDVDEDYSENPGEASITRKLWTFFTS